MPHLPFQELPVADPGTADTRTPLRYLTWVARHQRMTLIFNALFGVGWMVSQALLWAAVGAAVEHGVVHRHENALFEWVGVVIALGLIQAICGALRHQLAVTNWMKAAYRTTQIIGRHVAHHGTAVSGEVNSGDVVNTVASDAMRIGGAFDVLARFTGAVTAWLVVSVILLGTSVQLGLVVLLGVPILAALTSPLMKPLHSAQAAQRDAAGRLAALGADTVAGLRILRGVGGEEVFLANYRRQSQLVRRSGVRIATPQAALESGQILLPAVLTTIVTFLGALDVQRGILTPGQLVAFFGYSTFLTTPLRTAIEYVISTTRAYVGAGRVARILDTRAELEEPESPLVWPASFEKLHDSYSGVSLRRGELVALVTETPAEASNVVDRLGHYIFVGSQVTLDHTPLSKYSLADTRRHILVSDVEPRLFSGELREELDPHGNHDDSAIRASLERVSALDILDVLDAGLDAVLEERGRGFSGGQRQRLNLARVLLSRADILLLVEPTSAVDTHTEGRIAQRLCDLRQHRTTLVATTSPLILDVVDEVVFVKDGRLLMRGPHDSLVLTSADYRRIVLREDA